jgi:hypothetical protein
MDNSPNKLPCIVCLQRAYKELSWHRGGGKPPNAKRKRERGGRPKQTRGCGCGGNLRTLKSEYWERKALDAFLRKLGRKNQKYAILSTFLPAARQLFGLRVVKELKGEKKDAKLGMGNGY